LRADWRLPRLQFGDRYRLVDPSAEGIAHIARFMRQADRDEVTAASGSHDFEAVLHACVSVSEDTLMGVTPEGEAIGLFGVVTVSLLSNKGSPWMLCTDSAHLHQRALVRGGRAYSVAMLEQYERLENHVDARNHRAVAWLQRCGYTIGEPVPYGPLGMPFHPFSMTR
jgi:hypothetical protein